MITLKYMIASPFIAVAVSFAAQAQSIASSPTSIVALRVANDREVMAFLATDADALAALWAKDFLVTNPLNKVATKAEVLAMVRGGMLSFKSYKRQIETIRRYDSVAVIVGSENVEWAGKMPLAGKALPLRFTAVWHIDHGRWQQVARHANVVWPTRT